MKAHNGSGWSYESFQERKLCIEPEWVFDSSWRDDPRYHLSENILMVEPDWSIQYTCITVTPVGPMIQVINPFKGQRLV